MISRRVIFEYDGEKEGIVIDKIRTCSDAYMTNYDVYMIIDDDGYVYRISPRHIIKVIINK